MNVTGRRVDIRHELELLKARARGVFQPPPSAGEESPPEPGGAAVDRSVEQASDAVTPPLPRVGTPSIPRAVTPPVPVVKPPSVPRTGSPFHMERPPRPSGPLDSIVPGTAVDTAAGSFWRVTTGASAVHPEATRIHEEYLEVLAGPVPGPESPAAPLGILQKAGAGGILYLDIETTGLSCSPLFLIGLMFSSGGELVFDQLFARDYTEERAVLAGVGETLGRYRILVTFNGARFDLPFIAERMADSGMRFDPPPVHVDLLPVSRSACAGRTPNHRLQTLERFVLGRARLDDIPGSEIPDAYHEYVRTGDAGEMAAVILHNRLDLLSMLELVTVYLAHC